MDMREMVDKVKKGEPLYGHSTLTPYMQGVAARNSRFSSLMSHVVPWANFVNHNQVSPAERSPTHTKFGTDLDSARRGHGEVLPTSRTRTRGREAEMNVCL